MEESGDARERRGGEGRWRDGGGEGKGVEGLGREGGFSSEVGRERGLLIRGGGGGMVVSL